MKKVLILLCLLKAPSIYATDEKMDPIQIPSVKFELDQKIGRDDFCSSNFSSAGNRAAVVAGEVIDFFSITNNSFFCKSKVKKSSNATIANNNSKERSGNIEIENSRPMISFNSSGACLVALSYHNYPLQCFNASAAKLDLATPTLNGNGGSTYLFEPYADPKELQMVGFYNDGDYDWLLRDPNHYNPINLRQLSGSGKTQGISFSPDGTLLAAIGYDHVNIWKMPKENEELKKLSTFKFESTENNTVQNAVFSLDNKYIAIPQSSSTFKQDKNAVMIYSLEKGEEIFKRETMKMSTDKNIYCWFDSEGKSIAITVKESSVIEIWNFKNKKKKAVVTLGEGVKIRHAVGCPENDMAMIVCSTADDKASVLFFPSFFNSYKNKYNPINPSISTSKFEEFKPLLKNVGVGSVIVAGSVFGGLKIREWWKSWTKNKKRKDK